MKIGIIGAGNVATHLVKGLVKAGEEVTVVYSRTLGSAQELTQALPSAAATDSLDFLSAAPADVYLIAVPDQAVQPVLQQAVFPPEALVAHTSGTLPREALSTLTGVETGVFYPLQTFSKEKEVDWARIPICVEASCDAAENQLLNLGRALSQQVVKMAGAERKQLHVAAVFACNFTNHLWGVAQEILQKAALPVTLLQPLVQETMHKAFQFNPFEVQTGPAQRGDQDTLEAHLRLLAQTPQYQQLYQALTASIQTTAGQKADAGKAVGNP
ncbi:MULTISPECIES: Rossmann-like and DUF2520 domain-containing protein [Rufibacter]|uniref:Putative short-subunit dehydrogenase-like oxidoreductase (DUF2520 family) n=1 Tax=Rufibacter quisquiliarum TaxID=1549639 RepID=A0A839GM03_9BACT|nr:MULTISPECIES: Rossmann-like and DUF2520 domain-containing protein [Rufibacter]MBA9076605.1 putative short-subunit dehydrogenase-like oxidoreductase (DUF2520 family) [Rufibacter quisquiliarum]